MIFFRKNRIDNFMTLSCFQKTDEIEKVQESFLTGNEFDYFKEKRGKSFVYKVDIGGKSFYLKRNEKQGVRSILRNLLRMEIPHSDSVWEYLAVKEFRNHGLKVMAPVAYGEELLLGIWPTRGYMLVEEVKGEEVCNVFLQNDDSLLRKKIVYSLGRYIGEMHGKGFLHSPRIHDFIYRFNKQKGTIDLTMIDIDLKGQSPKPCSFTTGDAIDALVVSFYLFIRSGHSIKKDGVRNFFTGYIKGLSLTNNALEDDYEELFKYRLSEKIAEHNSDAHRIRLFSEVPGSVVSLL